MQSRARNPGGIIGWVADQLSAGVVVRFPDEVDEYARDALNVALEKTGLDVTRGLPVGHRGVIDDFLLATLNVAAGMPDVVIHLATTVRDWLRTQPRTAADGARTAVEIEDRATGITVRITADDPDHALRLLETSLASVGDEPIVWLGRAWGVGRPESERDRTVFVVHGRDKQARQELYIFLRAIGLHPIEWTEALAQTGEGAPYVGEVVAKIMGVGRVVIVLLTPDDVVYLKPEHADDDDDPDLTPYGQARPNVLFEAGMAFATFAEHTLLVELGKVRPFTDIGGRNIVKLNNSAKKRKLLAQRLIDIGCAVNLRGSDWLQVANLTPPA
jgi:predicted nucleotide-binding protein